MVRRTKEEALETRHRLLDAAEVLFQAQGVSQTSLQQIAQQAGATRGAIYWHFKDKADLFNAMMDRVTLPLEAAVAKAAARHDADPMDDVEHQMVEALKLMTTDIAGAPRVRGRHAQGRIHPRHGVGAAAPPGSAQRLRGRFREGHGGRAPGATRMRLPIPAAAAAQGLHALISGLIQNWLLDPAAFDLVATGRQTFRVYLAGLGFARPLARRWLIGDNGGLPTASGDTHLAVFQRIEFGPPKAEIQVRFLAAGPNSRPEASKCFRPLSFSSETTLRQRAAARRASLAARLVSSRSRP